MYEVMLQESLEDVEPKKFLLSATQERSWETPAIDFSRQLNWWYLVDVGSWKKQPVFSTRGPPNIAIWTPGWRIHMALQPRNTRKSQQKAWERYGSRMSWIISCSSKGTSCYEVGRDGTRWYEMVRVWSEVHHLLCLIWGLLYRSSIIWGDWNIAWRHHRSNSHPQWLDSPNTTSNSIASDYDRFSIDVTSGFPAVASILLYYDSKPVGFASTSFLLCGTSTVSRWNPLKSTWTLTMLLHASLLTAIVARSCDLTQQETWTLHWIITHLDYRLSS